jgi:hypothetical protein
MRQWNAFMKGMKERKKRMQQEDAKQSIYFTFELVFASV